MEELETRGQHGMLATVPPHVRRAQMVRTQAHRQILLRGVRPGLPLVAISLGLADISPPWPEAAHTGTWQLQLCKLCAKPLKRECDRFNLSLPELQSLSP